MGLISLNIKRSGIHSKTEWEKKQFDTRDAYIMEKFQSTLLSQTTLVSIMLYAPASIAGHFWVENAKFIEIDNWLIKMGDHFTGVYSKEWIIATELFWVFAFEYFVHIL